MILKKLGTSMGFVVFSAVCACSEPGPDVTKTARANEQVQSDEPVSLQPGVECATTDCGSNGTCAVSTDGEAFCVCYAGHEGERCAECAPGYQDRDGDGRCSFTCKLADLQCERGACSTLSGVAVCECDEGYAGLRCELCSTGYQDEDLDGRCELDCEATALDCGPAGACSTATGIAICACEPGYTGERCDQCDAGYQDNDGDAICAASCESAGLECPIGNTCYDDSGEALCACLEGYQDKDGDGTCAPSCVYAQLNCGSRSVCSDVSGLARCHCPAGASTDDADGSCFDIYVDSVNGDDANTGDAPSRALLTLAAATDAAVEFGDGVRIGLARGSVWRSEGLHLQALEDVVVESYGHGPQPLIDGAKEVLIWQTSEDRGDAFSAVYSADVSFASSRLVRWISVSEDDVVLAQATSIENVDQTPGSYFSVVDSEAGTGLIFVHPRNSLDPRQGASVIRAASVSWALDVNSGLVSGVHTRLTVENNGSVDIWGRGVVERVLATNGTKHNLLIGSGVLRDVIAIDGDDGPHVGSSSLLVAYERDPTYSSIELERVIVGLTTPPTALSSGFYCHGSPGTAYASLRAQQVVQFNASNFAGQVAGVVDMKDFYAIDVGLIRMPGTPGTPVSLERFLVYSEAAQSRFFAVGDWSLRDSVGYFNNSEVPGQASLWLSDMANDVVVTNSTWVIAKQRNFMFDGRPSGDLAFHGNVVFGARSTLVDFEAPVGEYSGDHNVYWIPGERDFFAAFRGLSIEGLGEWQSRTGQDLNSVYLTDDQAVDFFLGEPSMGDFRVNPDAQVTGSDGTIYVGEFPDGTPISKVGAQAHWNWGERRIHPGAPARWPKPPRTLDEANQYVGNPTAWPW